jgi:hypothetical protein
VRRTENLFLRHGVRALLVAKFLPGLTTVMPPLAGIFRGSRLRFVLYDLAGVILWAGLWAGVGYVFSETIEVVARRVSALGRTAGFVVVAALVGYVLLKYVRRQLFLRRLRIARISPYELKRKLDAGEEVAILDLRTALDVAATPCAIPGSRWTRPRRSTSTWPTCLEIGSWCSIVPDPTKPRAPGWRSCSSGGDHACPPARGGNRAVDDPGVPGQRVGGAGDPSGRARAALGQGNAGMIQEDESARISRLSVVRSQPCRVRGTGSGTKSRHLSQGD